MARPHGTTAAGVPVDLIGQPLTAGRGSVSGVHIVTENDMAKAQANGIYTLNGGRYRIRKGDPFPDGAVMDGAEVAEEVAPEPVAEERSKGAAPENRARAEKAEKR